MAIETTPFDAAEYLDNPVSQAVFFQEALDTGDTGYIVHALGVIVRAQGMSQLAIDAGVTREALYKALSTDGDPRLSTLTSVTSALGVKVRADMTVAQSG